MKKSVKPVAKSKKPVSKKTDSNKKNILERACYLQIATREEEKDLIISKGEVGGDADLLSQSIAKMMRKNKTFEKVIFDSIAYYLGSFVANKNKKKEWQKKILKRKAKAKVVKAKK